ncbi:MAG: ParB/RepB/Spo0J family partition protein [Ruminococcaceae bacterium]|nr:ParB/RepB/Spo0J family partition protein [Oscillospiraceae bacterium]
MAKKKGLGRGLDAIFQDNSFPEETESKSSDRLTVPISMIDTNPGQPRKAFDNEALAELADSISANGLLQPILVREVAGRYEIIAGERRYRASRMAGLSELPVIVVEADDLATAKYALIENLQRENLNAYEEAAAYESLMKEYSLTQEEISIQIGKSRSAIANSLRLLDLPDEVVKLLVSGFISAGHGRALLGLKNREEMLPLAERIVAQELSVRDVESIVRSINKKKPDLGDLVDGPIKVDYNAELEQRFTNVTGRRCKITNTGKKKNIKIEFADDEDLCDILKKLAGNDFFENY